MTTDHSITHDGAAVVGDYYWQPLSTCPRGVKVQLLTEGGVAVYGQYNGDPGYRGWQALPKIPKDWK